MNMPPSTSRPHRLVTEWSTDSDELAAMLTMIANEQDMETRLELEASLHMFLARVAWQDAAGYRRRRLDRLARQRRKPHD